MHVRQNPCQTRAFLPPLRRPRTVFAGTLLLAVTSLLASVLVSGASADPDADADLVARLHAARAAAGVAPLRVTVDLNAVAQEQSERMAAQDRLDHNPELLTDVTVWLRLSENVGY